MSASTNAPMNAPTNSAATNSAARRLRVLPSPETRPPIISPDELMAIRHTPYVQDSLALDFDADDATVPALFTRRADLPDPHLLVGRLAQAFLEVMAGIRPAAQIVRHTSPDVYAALCRRAAVAARRPPGPRRPAIVRRVRIQEPADGVVEAAVVIVQHDRVRAMAIRLGGLDGRWVATALHVG